MAYTIIKKDPTLKPYENDIARREKDYREKKAALCGDGSLSDFANAHEYFGFHPQKEGWIYREWAPGADEMFLTGDFCSWSLDACPMEKKENGVFEVAFTGKVGDFVQAIVIKDGKTLRRVPVYATRVEQDPTTCLWCARLEDKAPYPFTVTDFKPPKHPIIYECHIGMASEEGKVASYNEFREKVLPRVKALGYNTLQIMAVQEHPYYGSFGYQVSNFYAPSSRFGSGEDLKRLIDTAHSMGIAVLLDVVHSHAVKNVGEGLYLFDGTPYQYFHEGERGHHPAWDTKLFNYGKNEVLHFLLSNLKYWMEVFHFDGFRFDGVTSMLYRNHGLGEAFTNYGMYFSMNTDTEAVTYLMLANDLVHSLKPDAITVAEDMSGMPGIALPLKSGGMGFDFRLAMGVPDYWIKLLKDKSDYEWDVGNIFYELTNRRRNEKCIGYVESHDQALVGDKTVMFRLADAAMYTHMSKNSESAVIDRAVALHKMLRLVTASLSGDGYLNFMGNEFGHPEWIDFPREGNGWSYHYCRRQWHLADDDSLRYGQLEAFDKAMLSLLSGKHTFGKTEYGLWQHTDDHVLIYEKAGLIFAFNFHPEKSFTGYFIPTLEAGEYAVSLTTDDPTFGGKGNVSKKATYTAKPLYDGRVGFFCYLPSRTATVFRKKTKRK